MPPEVLFANIISTKYNRIMLELYNFSQSTCSLKVRICLAEKKLDWVDHRLFAPDNDHLTPEYLKLNPNGVVPTLIHDGVPIIESSVILQYLDDAFPEVRLTPDDIKDVARMRAWLAYFDLVPTPAVRYPSFQYGGLARKFKQLTPEEFEDFCQRHPIKSDFYRRLGQTGFSDSEMAKAYDDVRKTVVRMGQALADGGPWIMGAQYTLADICVAPLLDRIEDLGHASLWQDDLPLVSGWLKRMQARPAYKTAYSDGSRLTQVFKDLELE